LPRGQRKDLFEIANSGWSDKDVLRKAAAGWLPAVGEG
jgi:hypothetical protein